MSPRQFLRLLPLAAIAIVAACSEKFDTSSNCPVLCTDQSLVVHDTTFDIVQLDSAFSGFTGIGERWPAPGLPTPSGGGFLYETFVTVANRPDSLDVRQVFRFDTLPQTLSSSDTTPITAVTDSRLLLVIDTVRSVFSTAPVTIDVFDLDDSTLASDTAQAPLALRFTAARKIASRSFTRADVVADTIAGFGTAGTLRALSITIPDSVMLSHITGSHRLRIGLRVTSAGSAAIRLVAPSVNSAGLVPRLTYDPSPDTAIKAWQVSTLYSGTTDSPELLRGQTLVLRDLTSLLNDGSIEAGGLRASRSLLQVTLPRSFLDTVTVVRATLDLTQRPKRSDPGAADGVRIRARVAIAGPVFGTDVRRQVELLDPLLEGVQLPSLLIAPRDSGVKSFDVAAAVRVWLAQDATIPTSFVLYSEGEAFQEQRAAFYSHRSAIASVRPRLRVTYTTRREGVIP